MTSELAGAPASGPAVRSDHVPEGGLEALGRLAAGIAHEINTPIQFVGDNTRFLQEVCAAMLRLLATYRRVLHDGALTDDERRRVLAAAEAEADLDDLLDEVPAAVAQTLEGVDRVATIVRAMKAFSYRREARGYADVNEALRTTLVVARNELKYVADVECDLGELPPVLCSIAELHQVFLNLLVNAADAIGEVPEHGRIRVRSRLRAGAVEVSITDNGGGIPDDILDRVFEPFFTTKGFGRGTGQGLALVHEVVCTRHGGRVDVHSEVGVGTTIVVTLPVDGPDAAA